MHADRTPLFCDTVAVRIERAETQFMAECATGADAGGFVRWFAGGVATYAETGSPYNKVAGIGFDGVPDTADLDQIERAFAARRVPTQIELAHLADPEIATALTTRGYRLESFENVLGLALDREHERITPPGIVIRPSGDDEFEQWLDVLSDAVARPDTQGVPWHEEFPRETYQRAMRHATAAGIQRYAALHDGILAGGAGLRMTQGVAQFTGAGTAPAHRRHGIQSALLSARLADARAAGCDVAVVTVQPGSRSQQNAQRQGFDLLYTRAVLVRRS